MHNEAVKDARLAVYWDTDAHWALYQLGEKLTDLEVAFRLWRFRHVTTVERVIGFKRGTGGTGGVATCARCWTWCCSRDLAPAHEPVRLGPPHSGIQFFINKELPALFTSAGSLF